MKALNLVTFITSNLVHSHDEGITRLWYTEPGVWVGLYYFPLPPDFEADITDTEALTGFLGASSARAGIGFVETWPLVEFDGYRGVRRPIKRVENPDGRGRIYVGSVTLPFRDFSYVIKVEAAEGGFTGIREMTVVGELSRQGLLKEKADRIPSSEEEIKVVGAAEMEGWTVNVIDDSIPAHF